MGDFQKGERVRVRRHAGLPVREGEVINVADSSPGRGLVFVRCDEGDVVGYAPTLIERISEAAPQRGPGLKVGDVVRVTAGGFTETGWSGTVFRFHTKANGELVAVVNFGERLVGYLFSQLERVEDDLHADGDPSDKARIAKLEEDLAEAIENCAHWASDYRELQAGNRADEEGRRVVGLRDAVVEAALAWRDNMHNGTRDLLGDACDALNAAVTPPEPVDPRAELDAAIVDVLAVVDMSVRSNAQKVARVSRARAAMAREAK